MSCIEELEKKYMEFDSLMKTCLPKVDVQVNCGHASPFGW